MADDQTSPDRPRRRPLIGAQVRRLRTDRGLTLAQVRDRTGLNVGYLSQVETDKASPSLETLAALADALEVPITWLLIDAAPPPRVVRCGERRIEEGPGDRGWRRSMAGMPRTVRFVEGVMPPGTNRT